MYFFKLFGSNFLVSLIIILFSTLAYGSTEQQRPNILLILADDLGMNDISSWGDGTAPTPTIDKLSRESIRFRRHYTDSTCSPSRAALLTGRHPLDIGFQPIAPGLSSDLDTLPKSLRKEGYYTAHIGKWHVGELLNYPEILPGHQGFEYWFGFANQFTLQGPGPNGEILQLQPTYNNPWLQENDAAPQQYQGSLDDILTTRAIELISQQHGKPWFINLWLMSPHTPYQPSTEFKAKFDDTPLGNYLAVLNQLDHNVQRLLDSIEKLGIAQNTIVVFTSDNGNLTSLRDNNYPLVGHKFEFKEGGVRVPLLIQWSGYFSPADVSDITHITDIYPTLLALVGGQVPAEIMGRDISPALSGESLAAPAAYYWEINFGEYGLVYAGHVFSKDSIFLSAADSFTFMPMSPALPLVVPQNIPVPTSIDTIKAKELFKNWESKIRPVPLNWAPSSSGDAGVLSGREMQRSPVYGPFTIGVAMGRSTRAGKEQVIFKQDDLWSLHHQADGRFIFHYGNTKIFSEPVKFSNKCNTLIFGVEIYPELDGYMPSKENSHTVLYVNGTNVIDDRTVLRRPSEGKALLNPTYVGSATDGTKAYGGGVGRPIVVSRLLLPQQEGYTLSDMQAELCSPENFN